MNVFRFSMKKRRRFVSSLWKWNFKAEKKREDKMQKELKTALRRELWLHFIIAFNLFFPISFDAVNFIIDGVFQSYFTPRLKNESFMVLHFSPNEQTTWKIPKRGKSYEAKGWDIIISLDLCSPLSLAHSFFVVLHSCFLCY